MGTGRLALGIEALDARWSEYDAAAREREDDRAVRGVGTELIGELSARVGAIAERPHGSMVRVRASERLAGTPSGPARVSRTGDRPAAKAGGFLRPYIAPYGTPRLRVKKERGAGR